MNKLTMLFASCVVAISGCSFMSPEVVPSGPDTYSVTSDGAGFSSAGVRADVYKTANKFCVEQGLVMVPVSMDSHEGELGRRPPSATLVFRALKPGDPEIKRVNVEGPDTINRVQYR